MEPRPLDGNGRGLRIVADVDGDLSIETGPRLLKEFRVEWFAVRLDLGECQYQWQEIGRVTLHQSFAAFLENGLDDFHEFPYTFEVLGELLDRGADVCGAAWLSSVVFALLRGNPASPGPDDVIVLLPWIPS